MATAPPNSRTIGGQITAIESSTEFQIHNATCGYVYIYYNQPGTTTAFDPSGSSPAINDYAQVTGIETSSCSSVTSALYLTLSDDVP